MLRATRLCRRRRLRGRHGLAAGRATRHAHHQRDQPRQGGEHGAGIRRRARRIHGRGDHTGCRWPAPTGGYPALGRGRGALSRRHDHRHASRGARAHAVGAAFRQLASRFLDFLGGRLSDSRYTERLPTLSGDPARAPRSTGRSRRRLRLRERGAHRGGAFRLLRASHRHRGLARAGGSRCPVLVDRNGYRVE